jgi:hypothetical protein
LIGFVSPPTFYRTYYEQEYVAVKEIAEKFAPEMVTVIASDSRLSVVADNLSVQDLDIKNLPISGKGFVIIENEYFIPDPTLSQGATSTDRDFSEYLKRQDLLEKEWNEKVFQITTSEEFKEFKLVDEYAQFKIYESEAGR